MDSKPGEPDPAAVSSGGADRRGKPVGYVSYWSAQRRRQRSAIFQAREDGTSVAVIAVELGISVADVEQVLRGDRRRRRRDRGARQW